MRYLSVCSGIEAATVAWHPLGWQPVAFSEVDRFASEVLARHYPNVPNWGDMTKFEEWPDADVDVLVGGTPCQSFSVAGLRKGLRDPRGNLMLTYLAIAAKYRPRWLVWENVPGVLSSNGGRDFGAFLAGLGECGYGFAYRILDAQYFGLAQRRKRVFVIGCIGDWRRAAAVLLEREGLRGDSAPCREAGKGFAAATVPSLTASGRGVERTGESRGQDPVVACPVISPALKARDSKGPSSDGDGDGAPLIAHALRGEGFDASEDGTGRGTPLVPVIAPTLRAMNANGSHANAGGQVAVAFDLRGREGGAMPEGPHDTANIRAASGGSSRSYVATPMAVRRLTPTECERLQGFPDGYTRIPYRNKPADRCPDGPRYKALGNSMAVPVMRWLGERIAMVEGIE